MRPRIQCGGRILALLLGCCSVVAADDDALPRERQELIVPRVERAPTLGDFLDMQAPPDLARSMVRVEGFIQRTPEDGKPASQRTQVYLGYDDLRFHAVFVAFDSEPEKMRARLGRRENIFGDEIVEIQLDTYHDERRAFSFIVNPRGVQWDAIWTEGQGFDESWDTVWDSDAQLTDQGYVVVMSIPFKSLRFPAAAEQRWGVVLVRDIPRNNEGSFWPRISNRIEGRLNQAATLTGLSGISPGRNVQLIPYATARSFRLLNDEEPRAFERDDFDADIGLDAKFVIRDSLALDATINPDFSQVESDQPQVTVNERFELFFPEKRPFFLENADYFQTRINLLFTRRIADPFLGVRLTGKTGAYSVGGLVTDDEAPGNVAAPGSPADGKRAWVGAFRLSRDIGRQSNIGVLYTDRRLGDGRNQVVSLDGRIKLDDNWVTRFQAAYSFERPLAGEGETALSTEDSAYDLEFNREGRKFTAHIHYRDIGPAFRTRLGFVPRVDVRDFHESINYRFRPEGRRLISWGPGLFASMIHDHDGLRLDASVEPSLSFEFHRQTSFSIRYSEGRARLRPIDFDELTEATDYPTNRLGVSFGTQAVKWVGLNANFSSGEGINFVPPRGQPPAAADQDSAGITLTFRLGSRLRIDNDYLMTQLDDPISSRRILINEIFRSRWSWQFNLKLSLRAIFQYDETDGAPDLTSVENRQNFNGDLLLTYLVHPGTAFYLGYNSNYRNLFPGENRGDGLFRTDSDYLNDARQLFFKISYLFRP